MKKSKQFIQSKLKIILAFFVVSFITFSTLDMISSSSGKTGDSENGCSCHGSNSSSTAITFSSGSGSFNVKSGSNTEFTVRVANSSKSKAGSNITVKTGSGGSNAGTLTAGSGLKTSGGELTHNGAQTMSGGGFDFKFSWTAPTDPGEYYIFAAGNAVDGNGNSNGDAPNIANQKITVMGVTLSGPNGGESLCAGGSRNITWTQFGIANVKIELLKGGVPTTLVASTPASTGSYTWNIPAGQEGGTDYKIRISDASDNSIVDESNANFSIGGLPSITTQISPITICTGKNATFTVAASGNGLSYKWFKNNSEIPGQTSASYTINNVKTTDAGKFKVQVINSCGNVMSNEVDLTVNQGPAFTKQPANAITCVGSNVIFTPEVLGNDNQYQWQKNGQNIAGATSLTYTINNVKDTDAGSYKLIITSQQCGDLVSSQEAILTINKATEITAQPTAKSVCEGSPIELSVVAVGSSLNYSWKLNGTAIPNTNKNTLTIAAAKLTDAGNYSVEVIGQCGNPVTSNVVKVDVGAGPTITKQPQGRTVVEGATVSMSVESTGENTYQWQKDNQNINEQTGPVLLLNSVTKADAGDYTCNVTNSCGTTKSAVAKLIINDGPKGPQLSLIKNEVIFAKTTLGSQIDTTLVDFISNVGDEELKINEIKVDIANSQNNGDFQVLSTNTPYILQKGEKMDLRIRFKPLDGGNRSVVIKLNTNGNSESINVSGEGAPGENNKAEFAVMSDLVEFNTFAGVQVTQKLKITNIGNIAGTINSFTKDKNIEEFSLITELPKTLNPSESIDLEFAFSPQAEGLFSDHWNFLDTENNVIARIKIEGISVINSIKLITLNSVKAFPNPTQNGAINLEFNAELKDYSENLTFEILDINGEIVNTFKLNNVNNNNTQNEVNYQLNWDGYNSKNQKVGSGIYFGRLNSANNGLSNVIKIVVE